MVRSRRNNSGISQAKPPIEDGVVYFVIELRGLLESRVTMDGVGRHDKLGQPSTLLIPFYSEDVKTQESDTAINTSLMQKKDDMIKRMNRRGGYTKKFAGRRRTPYSTPQSSVIEETVTQPSEQTSLETLKVLKKAMETLREKRGTPETPLVHSYTSKRSL
nr:unnamed protein product [Haemonchus contortus]